jgi:hypothetical protein
MKSKSLAAPLDVSFMRVVFIGLRIYSARTKKSIEKLSLGLKLVSHVSALQNYIVKLVFHHHVKYGE